MQSLEQYRHKILLQGSTIAALPTRQKSRIVRWAIGFISIVRARGRQLGSRNKRGDWPKERTSTPRTILAARLPALIPRLNPMT